MNDDKSLSFSQFIFTEHLNYYEKQNKFYVLLLNLKKPFDELEKNEAAMNAIASTPIFTKKNEFVTDSAHAILIYFSTHDDANAFGWNFMKQFPEYAISYNVFKPIFFIDTYWPNYKIRKETRATGLGKDGLWSWLFLWRAKRFTVEVANKIANKYGAFRRQGVGKDAMGWGFSEYRQFAGAIKEMRGKLYPLEAYIPTNIQCHIAPNETVYLNDIFAENLREIAGHSVSKPIIKI